MLHFPTSCYLSVNFSMPREDEMSSGKNGGRYKDDSTNISGVWTTFMRAFVKRKKIIRFNPRSSEN